MKNKITVVLIITIILLSSIIFIQLDGKKKTEAKFDQISNEVFRKLNLKLVLKKGDKLSTRTSDYIDHETAVNSAIHNRLILKVLYDESDDVDFTMEDIITPGKDYLEVGKYTLELSFEQFDGVVQKKIINVEVVDRELDENEEAIRKEYLNRTTQKEILVERSYEKNDSE